MKSLLIMVGSALTVYLAWSLLRKAGDTPLQAGGRLAKAATSGAPVTELASQLTQAWSDHRTTA